MNENINNLSCEIVEDLMPLYVDGIAGEESCRAVEGHVSNCEHCRQTLARMKRPMPDEDIGSEIDIFKKVRRRNRRAITLGIVGAAAVILGVLIFELFVATVDIDSDKVYCRIQEDGNTLKVTAHSLYDNPVLTDIVFEEKDGVVEVKFKGHRMGFSGIKDIKSEYSSSETIIRVCSGDLNLWDSGIYISQYASKVFATRHDFVGDPSANAKTAEALGIYDNFGDLTYELQTETEPYGMTIVINTTLCAAPGEDISTFEKMFIKYSCALMALIGNLEEVTFRFNYGGSITDSSNKGDTKEFVVPLSSADKHAGGSVKELGRDCADFQRLLNKLELGY
ncbi:MAG: DUF4825 domain-containing protein [Eubacteriaceae bacterium]|nr:DUF4825 domain-containing protein [Eubacteriaceae bacterium]